MAVDPEQPAEQRARIEARLQQGGGIAEIGLRGIAPRGRAVQPRGAQQSRRRQLVKLAPGFAQGCGGAPELPAPSHGGPVGPAPASPVLPFPRRRRPPPPGPPPPSPAASP